MYLSLLKKLGTTYNYFMQTVCLHRRRSPKKNFWRYKNMNKLQVFSFQHRKSITKRALLLILAVCISTFSVISFSASTVSAATTLTTAQKQTVLSCGFPSAKSSYIDAYYATWESYGIIDGSYTMFGAFCNFVSNMDNETTPTNVNDFAKVARALYSEVSNHTNKIAELYAINDCLINRMATGSTIWNTYYKAASKYGMDAINPSAADYWAGAPCRNPLADSASSSTARRAVVEAYVIAFESVGAYYAPVTTILSSLPSYYKYFQETSYKNGVAGYAVGSFYFYKN